MTPEQQQPAIDWGDETPAQAEAPQDRHIEEIAAVEDTPGIPESQPATTTFDDFSFSETTFDDYVQPHVVPPPHERLDLEDFDDTDHEPFDRPGAHKLGIVGGKGVGKSYLFHAMVYRTYSGLQSGALTQYLERDAMHLFAALGETDQAGQMVRTGAARALNRVNFISKYQNWQRLPFTTFLGQHWYRLRLPYRTGWLGKRRSAMDVEFFDGSGEGFFQMQTVSAKQRELWERAYGDARVMVFCLPLWAAFPDSTLTDKDWETRDELLEGFEQVVQNYETMRGGQGRVSSILALTMSDDRRGALKTLRDRWIMPYIDSPNSYLKQLRRGSGVARYINNARIVSEAIQEEFASARDPRITDIPQRLDFGQGKPWIVALSAVEGLRLDDLESRYPNPDDPARLREVRTAAPTPVHVELPLLLALCDGENALM